MTDNPEKPVFPFILRGRSFIRISGSKAASFLNGIITADIDSLADRQIAPSALLSPQGKILFDFLIARLPQARETEIFQIDIAAPLAEAFCRLLRLYRLRRAVEISAPQACSACIADRDSAAAGRDMRFPQARPVWRSYSAADDAGNTRQAEWDALRIAFAVPEGGRDFILGDAFPHDVNYDALGAVSFNKGCYIGQEVVSRMRHKATIRKRIVHIEGERNLPPEGADILAGGKIIGRLGTVCGRQGLALARIDKLPPADSAPAQAGGVNLHFAPPLYLPHLLERESLAAG